MTGRAATIVIFPGVRYERLDDTPSIGNDHPAARKKPAARRKKVTG